MGLELSREEENVAMATLRCLFNCFSQRTKTLRTKRCRSRTYSHL